MFINSIWQDEFAGSLVYIFDRFGKLLKALPYNSEGWDGNYNGHPMPSDDYWFLVNVKYDGEQFEVRGHFTLKR